MSTTHVLSSAMMPKPGKYEMLKISESEFMDRIKQAFESGSLKSSVGYTQNINYIHKKSGIRIALSRDSTKIQSGDVLLIMKLAYRLENSDSKGNIINPNDYEFFIAHYE